MLNEKNVKFLVFEGESEEESDWRKVDKAIDNIKIGDIETKFSLPIEFNETLEKLPRRILKSKAHNYTMFVSPKKVGFRLSTGYQMPEKPPDEENEKKTHTLIEILKEGESNFKLFIGAFLGARSKATETMKIKWRIRFEFPLKEHFVQYVKTDFLDTLRRHNPQASFALEEMLVSRNTPDERITYEVLEDIEDNVTRVEIVKNFKSSLVTIDLVKFVQDAINSGNEFLSLMGNHHVQC